MLIFIRVIILYEIKSMIDIKEYGKVHVKLSVVLDKRHITRNKLRTLTGIKSSTDIIKPKISNW